jgi:acetate kinase
MADDRRVEPTVGGSRGASHGRRHCRYQCWLVEHQVLAFAVYVYRIRREVGSLTAALDGLDALVFTAGIGENAAPIRERVCAGLEWLGLEPDPAANTAGGPLISAPASRVNAWVIPTNEELMIARHTRSLVDPGRAG